MLCITLSLGFFGHLALIATAPYLRDFGIRVSTYDDNLFLLSKTYLSQSDGGLIEPSEEIARLESLPILKASISCRARVSLFAST